jgi:spermidine synthase
MTAAPLSRRHTLSAVRYVELARATSERGEIVLRERHDDEDAGTPVIELRVNGVYVMDSMETSTEEALALTALAHVDDPKAVVVAGLGLGYTAHAVLTDPRVERLAVVEIEEALVEWLRDGTVPHGPAFLADERVKVVTADIRQAVAEARQKYDLVLLDVDNGPRHLVHEMNAAVYEVTFLRSVRSLLRPRGAVAVWSSTEAPELYDAMATVFGEVKPVPLGVELQGRMEEYWLYLAHRDAP